MRAAFVALMLVSCGRTGFDALDTRDGSGGPPTRSCEGLANTCGPFQTGSCCENALVTGGTYARSHDVSADGMFPDSSFAATVSDFRLDKYEVTVGRFRKFVNEGGGTLANPPLSGGGAHPNIAGSGWDASWNGNLLTDGTALAAALQCDAAFQTWTDTPADNESRPINCVDWYEAMAFCAWDGGFLATEAEWNYAATGGSEQRAYPWSVPPGFLGIDGTRASYYDATRQCIGDGVDGCTLADLIVVGTKPAGDGRWGQSDLGGNVWEWTLDWYASTYAQNPCPDCANLTPAAGRVIRGGLFQSPLTSLRAANRSFDVPTDRFLYLGLRCARTP